MTKHINITTSAISERFVEFICLDHEDKYVDYELVSFEADYAACMACPRKHTCEHAYLEGGAGITRIDLLEYQGYYW